MRCPYCDHHDSSVTDSRAAENGVRRRRECARCGLRFTTYERVQRTPLLVVKRDARREQFSRDKLTSGIVKACTKRPVPLKEIDRVVDEVEAGLQGLGNAEIPATVLGEMVMERLRSIDRVAYVRFASVYRDFQDIEGFEQVVKDLRQDTQQLALMEGTPPPRIRGRRARGQMAPATMPRNLEKDGTTGGNRDE